MIVGPIDFFRSDAPETYNTYIGGLGATITTASALAAKLSITESNILNFFVDSNNTIKCNINADYTFLINAFNHNFTPGVTYYLDFDGYATGSDQAPFYQATGMKVGLFPSWATSSVNMFRGVSGSNKTSFFAISQPMLTPIGSTSGANQNFVNTNVPYYYTHASNQTNNGGSPDGDLTEASTNFTNIRYVSGSTAAPDPVDDLAASNISGSQLDLTWTAPASTNTIDLYVIFQDGAPIASTTSLSYTVTGLTELTSYTFEILVFDQEGNCSPFSNLLTESTIAYVIPTGNIVSYWNYNSDSLDQVGANDGTDTDITYAAGGIVGNGASFNGTTSNISVADSASLSFASSAFSIMLWVKFDSLGNMVILNKMGATTNREYLVQYVSTLFRFRLFSGGGTTVYKNIDYTISPTTGVWYHVAVTDDGSNNASGADMYINGANVGTKSLTGSYTGMVAGNNYLMMGQYSGGSSILFFAGDMDEQAIFNKKLSALEVYESYQKNLSGQYLTE